MSCQSDASNSVIFKFTEGSVDVEYLMSIFLKHFILVESILGV